MTSLPSVGATILACAIAFSFFTRGAHRPERPILWSAFTLHLAAAAAQVLITSTVYRQGDMLSYWRVGMHLSEYLLDDPATTFPSTLQLILQVENTRLPVPVHGVGSNTGSMCGIAALLALMTGGSLTSACMLISTASLIGKLLIFRAFKASLPARSQRAILLAVTCLPSLVFWSSGLLKESLTILPLGLAISGTRAFASGHVLRGALAVAIGCFAIGIFKAYLLFPMALGAAALLYARSTAQRPRRTRVRPLLMIFSAALAIALMVILGELFPRFSLTNLQEEAERLQAVGSTIEGGSNYALAPGSGDSVAIRVAMLPVALLTALFRPLIFETNNAQSVLAAVETSLFLFLFARAALRRRWRHLLATLLNSPTLTFCLAFVVSGGVAIGLSSTNFGTLSRYRAPILVFWIILLISMQPFTRREHPKATTLYRSRRETPANEHLHQAS